MSFVKVYVHFVFSTYARIPFLDSADLRINVWKHIKLNAETKDIFIDMVNGYAEHCHCLVSLGTDQTIQKVAQMIKGESSFWINKHQLTKEKFNWQKEYLAVAVSESHIERVRQYIKNQEKHHAKNTFGEEYNKFVAYYDFQIVK